MRVTGEANRGVFGNIRNDCVMFTEDMCSNAERGPVKQDANLADKSSFHDISNQSESWR